MSGEQLATGIHWRSIAKIICFIVLLIIANIYARDLMSTLEFPIRPGNEDTVHRTIMVSAALYAGLLAIPFVPGAEIGVALMVMLGPPIALLVYLCTVAGLSLGFIAGRIIPFSALARFASDVRLERTSKLLRDIELMDKTERLRFLVSKAPRRLLPLLLRHRYLALAIALNIPGNYLIGGGGGIALFAGVSRLFTVSGFMLTILIAVSPVPIAVVLFGTEFLAD